jgi:hypothetical protein
VSYERGFNKTVWMVVAQGGRWTVAEIRAAVGLGKAPVDRAVYAMTKNRLLEQYPGKPVTYGISKDCITPRQTTVGEMLKAMGVE